ncbi:MAG: hypothetical protein JJE09_13815 [Bacteroidia bacterium]|nr:hypothetical protein [Bacteroidia bacterium]
MIKKITIPYFPTGLKYITPLLAGGGIYLIVLSYSVFGGILILVAAIILTSNYVTEIDLGKKVYSDYLSILWLPVNMEKKKFTKIDRIVITKGAYAQTINTRSRSRQLDWADYTGTLLFDQLDSLDLLTKTDRTDLLKGIKEFKDFLNVDVEDRTTSQPYWIDMNNLN